MKFYNISNHASASWSKEQLDAVSALGATEGIIDICAGNIPADADESYVAELAYDIACDIERGSLAMVQGESTFCFQLIIELKSKGVRCFAACSERRAKEVRNEDGSVTKVAEFAFVRFREY